MMNPAEWALMDNETVAGWFLLAIIQERWQDAHGLAELCQQRGLISRHHADWVYRQGAATCNGQHNKGTNHGD
jgi:hypothetical protein